MKPMTLSLLLALLLGGCGGTYTKLDHPAPAADRSATDDCPNGINYKTGQCR